MTITLTAHLALPIKSNGSLESGVFLGEALERLPAVERLVITCTRALESVAPIHVAQIAPVVARYPQVDVQLRGSAAEKFVADLTAEVAKLAPVG